MNGRILPPGDFAACRWSLKNLWLTFLYFLCAAGCACAAIAVALPGCASGNVSPATGRSGLIRTSVERRHGPKPESEWNQRHLWRKIDSGPDIYIPQGYPVSAPRNDREGTWFVDRRDGKRLFVPNSAIGALRPGVLRGEAINATHWEYGWFHSPARPAPNGVLTLP